MPKSRNEGEESRLALRKTFDSVKKKLTFNEDYTTTMPYEAGKQDEKDNPFLKLLECEDGIPQFHHSSSMPVDEKARGD